MFHKHYNYLKNIILPGFLASMLIGMLIGVLITFFKLLVDIVQNSSKSLYIEIGNRPYLIPLAIIALLLISILSSMILDKVPYTKGGGIAVSEGVVRGNITYPWFLTFIFTIILSLLNFFIGLPFGTEGPSVQLGTSLSYGINNLLHKKNEAWKKYIMTSGSCAAFSVATGSPITGIIFSLEEIHKRFSPLVLLVGFSSIIGANLTSFYLCKALNIRYTFFSSYDIKTMPFKLLYLMLLLGIIIGIFVVVLNKLIKFFMKLLGGKLKNVPNYIKIFIAMILTFIFCLIFNDLLGGGHHLIEHILENKLSISLLIIYLIIKIILLSYSSTTGLTGGLFIPQLLLGAIIGAIFAKIVNAEEYYTLFVFAGMTSFMSAAVGCPLSGLTFAAESLSGINNIIPFAITIFASYIISFISRSANLYDLFLEKKYKELYDFKNYKVIEFDVTVLENSFCERKQIRDLLFSANIMILEVSRKEKQFGKMDNHGEKRLFSGDKITFRCQSYNIDETLNEIKSFVGNQEINYEILAERN